MEHSAPLLEIRNLTVSFVQYTRGFRQEEVQVISGIDLTLQEGQIMAIVGSSGSGKSLLAHAIMGILPDNARCGGTLLYKGEELSRATAASLRGRELALVPQSVNYLNPLMQVGPLVRETPSGESRLKEQRRIFSRYRLKPEVEQMYPHQLSGGMARRVLVSTAAISGARLIIADEPTPGMHQEDVQETLKQFRELAREGCGILLITHDIEAALQIADHITVLYAGSVMETAPAGDFSGQGERLRHPYSKALWRALPQNEFIPAPCSQPRPGDLPEGCLFQRHCSAATSDCRSERPSVQWVRDGKVRCIHAT